MKKVFRASLCYHGLRGGASYRFVIFDRKGFMTTLNFAKGEEV